MLPHRHRRMLPRRLSLAIFAAATITRRRRRTLLHQATSCLLAAAAEDPLVPSPPPPDALRRRDRTFLPDRRLRTSVRSSRFSAAAPRPSATRFSSAAFGLTPLRAEAFDPEDGNLTAAIERDASQLDTSVPGVYRISYEVQDSDGCVTRALRFVRVIALVATSDPAYLRQMCLRQVPAAAMTCEVGMQTHKKHLPNPAAFPACCLVVSEMDAAACFCDGAVVGELNARNATFFRDLQAFTPMACGFQVKTG